MKTHLQRLAAICGFVLVAGIFVLAAIYPYRPDSTLGWFVLLVLVLPVVLLFELAGEKLLNSNFVSRLGRVGRITYGVLVIGVVLVVVLAAFQVVEPFLSKWGA